MHFIIIRLDYPVSNFKEHKEKVDSLLSNKNISPLVNAARNLWKKWIVLKTVFVIPKLDRTKEGKLNDINVHNKLYMFIKKCFIFNDNV